MNYYKFEFFWSINFFFRKYTNLNRLPNLPIVGNMEPKKREKEFQEEPPTSDESSKKRRTSKKKEEEETLNISFPLESVDTSSFNLPHNQYLPKIPNYSNTSIVNSNLPAFIGQYPPQISSSKNQPTLSNISSSQSSHLQQEFTQVFFPTPYPHFSPQSIPPYPNLPLHIQVPNLSSTTPINQLNLTPQIQKAPVQRFVIYEQPNEKQRKSYRGENRFVFFVQSTLFIFMFIYYLYLILRVLDDRIIGTT